MMRLMSKIVVVVALLLSAVSVRAEQVLVAVAANFTSVARELVPLFEQRSEHRVKVSYGSTGKLYAQILNGAPFEVFLSADAERPQKALRDGLAVPGSDFTYALGRLALWSAQSDLFDQQSARAYLIKNQYPRLAIANPKTAPYGQAAKVFLKSAGLWGRTRARIVRGDSIAQTFQFVATGNAQLGFVALAQINDWQQRHGNKGQEGSLWVPSEQVIPPIVQEAVLLRRAEKNPAALAFHAFLKSDQAKAVIMAAGYGVVE